jgi:hypothetical protein
MNVTRLSSFSSLSSYGLRVGALALLLALSACGTTSNLITMPSDGRYKSAYMLVQHKEPTAAVPIDSVHAFEKALNKELYFESNPFYKGSGITLVYQFKQYEPGSRAKRFFTAGNSDEAQGQLMVETVFLNAKGQAIASLQTNVALSGGWTGGSMENALQNAAKEIAGYAKHYLKP